MNTDLYKAAASDDVKVLEKLLLHEDVDILSGVSHAGNSAVHIAAFYGSRKFVVKLLENIDRINLEGGVDGLLSRQNVHGNTALHEAAAGGKEEIVRILLNRSPELVRLRNAAGETAVFKAAVAGHTEIIDVFEQLLRPMAVEMYRRESDGQTSLHGAIFNKRTDAVEKLLNCKPELISEVDHLGRTPLHIAASIPPFKELVPPYHFWLKKRHIKENAKIADLLLSKDKSLCDKVDGGHQNPLHIAVKAANETVMKLILHYGGDCVEQVDYEGRNVLHLAVINAELIYERIPDEMQSMLKSLIAATQMLINDCDKHGKTALDMAIDGMNKDELLFSQVKKLLEKHGATWNANAVIEEKIPMSTSKWKTEIISWNSVLIGTAAIAAPFSLLQGNSNPLKGRHLHYMSQSEYNLFTVFFYAFFLADTVALGTSFTATVLLLFAVFGEKEDKIMVERSFLAVMRSLLAILIAYGCAVGLLLGPEYLWLTVTVLFVLVVTPIAIRVESFRCKLYMFTEAHKFIRFIAEDTFGLIISLIFRVTDIFILLCYNGFRYAFRPKVLQRNNN